MTRAYFAVFFICRESYGLMQVSGKFVTIKMSASKISEYW